MTVKPYFVPLGFGIDKLLLWGAFVLLFSFIPVSHVAAQTCATPPSDLVSWWTGDIDASDIQDGNDGVLTNGALAGVTGHVNGAFSLDGANDRIEIAHSPNLNPTAAITLDAWVKPDSIKGGSRIISKDISVTSCVNPFVVYSLELRGFAGDKADFFFATSDDVLHQLRGTSVISTGTFSHITATYDGAVAKIYVNGVLENSLAVSGTLKSSSTPVVIGNAGVACRAFAGGLIEFDGLIDEVEIYNRALSAQEIADIFNAGSAGKCKGVILTQALIAAVFELNVQQGISNALDAKLNAVVLGLDDLNQNNDMGAFSMLIAFIQNVEAQRGKKLTNDQANELIGAAQAIIDTL